MNWDKIKSKVVRSLKENLLTIATLAGVIIGKCLILSMKPFKFIFHFQKHHSSYKFMYFYISIVFSLLDQAERLI